MRRPTPFLWLAGLLLVLPVSLASQTARTVSAVWLHNDHSATKATRIEWLTKGTAVMVLDAKHVDGFYNVRAPDKVAGWVKGTYLEFTSIAPLTTDSVQPEPGDSGNAQTVGCGDHLWTHVYHPGRLLVKAQCVTVTGTIRDATARRATQTVDGTRHEPDGDTHGWLEVDSAFTNLLDMGNITAEQGNLVFEVICHFPIHSNAAAKEACGDYHDTSKLFKPGARVRITGTLVQETKHERWNEIHPVSSIDTVQH